MIFSVLLLCIRVNSPRTTFARADISKYFVCPCCTAQRTFHRSFFSFFLCGDTESSTIRSPSANVAGAHEVGVEIKCKRSQKRLFCFVAARNVFQIFPTLSFRRPSFLIAPDGAATRRLHVLQTEKTFPRYHYHCFLSLFFST